MAGWRDGARARLRDERDDVERDEEEEAAPPEVLPLGADDAPERVDVQQLGLVLRIDELQSREREGTHHCERNAGGCTSSPERATGGIITCRMVLRGGGF